MTSEILVIEPGKTRASDFSRQPGAWAGLPKADDDWDSPETNAAITKEFSGGEFL